jgi:hypothetical protein
MKTSRPIIVKRAVEMVERKAFIVGLSVVEAPIMVTVRLPHKERK